jgi:hypothetical protein
MSMRIGSLLDGVAMVVWQKADDTSQPIPASRERGSKNPQNGGRVAQNTGKNRAVAGNAIFARIRTVAPATRSAQRNRLAFGE